MLKEGLVLMCTGMGTVFMFLVLMIFTMMGMEHVVKWLNKIMPEEVEEIKPKKNALGAKTQEIAVAIAAVKALR
ncbi:MAG: OadG family protein [Candidatus Gastranaerophilales bacterium]|nr:OadG family protein [Candidatus Gastranaerophilales bacterium]